MNLWLPEMKSDRRKQRKDAAARLGFSEETKELPEDERKKMRAEWVRPSKTVQKGLPGDSSMKVKTEKKNQPPPLRGKQLPKKFQEGGEVLSGDKATDTEALKSKGSPKNKEKKGTKTATTTPQTGRRRGKFLKVLRTFLLWIFMKTPNN